MKINLIFRFFFLKSIQLPSEISLTISPESGEIGNTYNDFIYGPSQEAWKRGQRKGLGGELDNLTCYILLLRNICLVYLSEKKMDYAVVTNGHHIPISYNHKCLSFVSLWCSCGFFYVIFISGSRSIKQILVRICQSSCQTEER